MPILPSFVPARHSSWASPGSNEATASHVAVYVENPGRFNNGLGVRPKATPLGPQICSWSAALWVSGEKKTILR